MGALDYGDMNNIILNIYKKLFIIIIEIFIYKVNPNLIVRQLVDKLDTTAYSICAWESIFTITRLKRMDFRTCQHWW